MKRIILPLLVFSAFFAIFWGCEDNNLNPVNTTSWNAVLTDNSEATIIDAVVTAFEGDVIYDIDTTNEYGEFTLTNLPPKIDNVKIKIIHEYLGNFENKFDKFFNKDKPAEKGKIIFGDNDSCCGNVSVSIIDAVSNQPIPNAEVRISKGNVKLKLRKMENKPYIKFDHLCPGTYGLRISRENYQVSEQSIVITNCDSMGIVIAMTPKTTNQDSCCHGIAAIQILDSAAGFPVINVNVKLRKNGQELGAFKTDANGFVNFTGLCPGTYVVNYNKDYYTGGEFSFTAGCNDTLAFTKQAKGVCCDGIMKVSVKNSATGASLNEARVRLWKAGNVIGTDSAKNGFVIFRGLCEGKYSLDIVKTGYKGIEFEANVTCGDTVRLEKSLLKNEEPKDTCCKGIVKIFAKDSASQTALTGMTIKLRKGGNLISTKTTDGDGRVVFEGICPASYSISIIKDGYISQEFNFNAECNDSLVITKLIAKKQVIPDTCCTAKLKLIAKDKVTESALTGAEAKIYKNGQLLQTKLSNNDGVIIFEQLCAPSEYTVKVTKGGYHIREFTFKYTECNTLQETVKMETE